MRVWLAGILCSCLILFVMPLCIVSQTTTDFDVQEWLTRLGCIVAVGCMVVGLGCWAYQEQ